MREFFRSILAGCVISIGCMVNMLCGNRIVGALMFSTALYVICTLKLPLYTGKIGYAKTIGSKALLSMLIGNLLGCAFSWTLISNTRIEITDAANAICTVKLGDSLLSLFILGVYCGALMYAAVDGYRQTLNPLIIFACIFAFVICGFEHCIADMFYFLAARRATLESVLLILVIAAGNSTGSIILSSLAARKD